MLVTVIPKTDEEKEYFRNYQNVVKYLSGGKYVLHITKKSQMRDVTLVLLNSYSMDEVMEMISNNSSNPNSELYQ